MPIVAWSTASARELNELAGRAGGTVEEQERRASDGPSVSGPKRGGDACCFGLVASQLGARLTRDPSDDPDADLVARVGQGDEAAFRVLVTRKLARIHGLATRLLSDRALADDVAQDAFLRVWRSAGNWRPGEARFDTWLHRVVLNLCSDRLRKRRVIFVEDPPEQVDQALAADGRMIRDEAAARVRDAVGRLPPRQREAIVLNVYQDLSNTEAAAAMGVSIDALESLLSRARRSLRSMLGEARP